jgi:hypothetical protein
MSRKNAVWLFTSHRLSKTGGNKLHKLESRYGKLTFPGLNNKNLIEAEKSALRSKIARNQIQPPQRLRFFYYKPKNRLSAKGK